MFHTDFEVAVRLALAEHIPADKVPVVAGSVMDRISDHLAGTQVYIPNRNKGVALRNQRMRKAFTGNNYNALMRQFGLSRAQVYRILGK